MPLDVEQLLKIKVATESRRPKFLTLSERLERKSAIALQRRAHAVEGQSATKGSGSARKRTQDREDHAYIDEQYIRQSQVTNIDKKKRRTTDVRKFTFDWDAQDDTTDTQIPLTIQQHSAQPYGRTKTVPFDVLETGQYTLPRSDIGTESDVYNSNTALTSTALRESNKTQHWTAKERSQMKERDWRIFKEDFNIQIKGTSCANPIRSWSEANFPTIILSVIAKSGYSEPTSIQKATIPIALDGRDIIGVAETGSGKTASFVLPMLVHIAKLPPMSEHNCNDGPYALILAPTRELAQQIELETRKFASVLNITAVSIVGGHSIEEQSFNLRNGAEVIIATPGRLLDCLERHVLVLSQCRYVVMDEADRMVDLGFEDAVNEVLDALPSDSPERESRNSNNSVVAQDNLGHYRQTVMFSATMPPAVEKLARKYLKRPAIVIIGNAGQVVDTVEQRMESINGEEKRKRRMAEILNSGEFDRPVIVFVNTKKSCDMLAKYLHTIGWSSATLHGGKTQDQREASLKHLRSGEVDILVATDLAGRGIDVANVSLVLNFDMSKTAEDYVHRIGRTGRAGKTGVAITFFGDEDTETYKAIQMLAGQKRRQLTTFR